MGAWSEDEDQEYAELEIVRVMVVTEKALLVNHDGDEVWIPKSLIADPDQYARGVYDGMEVAEWFARKEGLI